MNPIKIGCSERLDSLIGPPSTSRATFGHVEDLWKLFEEDGKLQQPVKCRRSLSGGALSPLWRHNAGQMHLLTLQTWVIEYVRRTLPVQPTLRQALTRAGLEPFGQPSVKEWKDFIHLLAARVNFTLFACFLEAPGVVGAFTKPAREGIPPLRGCMILFASLPQK